MDITATVSDNLRATRERMKLSLDTVAKMTGVSKSMLAQIERGEVNPTISVLWKIANGLKVSFTSLLETRKEELEVIKASAIDPIVEDEGRFINQPVFGFDDERRFEFFRIVIQSGGSRESQAHLAGTEEYLTVFSGKVRVTVSGVDYVLSSGDSLRFRSDAVHSYRNDWKSPCELSMIIWYART
jgi:transcriptional regulator with XRE-family HTH domain